MYWQQTYVASVLKVLFSEIVKLEGRIFQEKKWESFERQTHTHTHTYTHTSTNINVYICRDEIGVAVQSWLWERVELMAW